MRCWGLAQLLKGLLDHIGILEQQGRFVASYILVKHLIGRG